jgi:acyl-CoA synthetase (AMP-forming)/AMP-acid ligase II
MGAGHSWLLRSSPEQDDSYVRSGAWRGRTLSEDFALLEQSSNDRVSIIEGGLPLTRSVIGTRARKVASAFFRLGLRPGDVVSFMLPNWPEVAILDLAAAMTGIVVNPIVPIYRSGESRFILNDCHAKILFVPAAFRHFDYVNMAQELRRDLPALEQLVVVRNRTPHPGVTTFEAFLDNEEVRSADLPKPAPSAVKLVIYTSGTTGVPKGVLHTHDTIGAEIRNVTNHWSLSERDTVFMPSPLTHITGYLYGIQLPLTVGMQAVYMDQWLAPEAFALLALHECAFTVAATPFLQQLTEIAKSQNLSLPALRIFACGGAPVSPDLILAAQDAFPNCIPCRVYGSTEAPTITLGPTKRERHIGPCTDGVIVGHTVKLIWAGREVGPGENGEVYTRGPEVFRGYTDCIQNTDSFDAEGYFRMGDLASRDHSNCLTITGRVKDLIIRGGENISAKEVEDVLHRHPAVLEVAVVAMPHPQMGETACAFIRPRPGQTISLNDVKAWIAQSGIAMQKTPERVQIVSDFPRTAAGKIKKVELRKIIFDMLQNETANQTLPPTLGTSHV